MHCAPLGLPLTVPEAPQPQNNKNTKILVSIPSIEHLVVSREVWVFLQLAA